MTNLSPKSRKYLVELQTKRANSNNHLTKLSYKTVVSSQLTILQLKPHQLKTSAREPHSARKLNSWRVLNVVGQKCALNQQRLQEKCLSLVKVSPIARTQCPFPRACTQLIWPKMTAFNVCQNRSLKSKSSDLSLNLKLSSLNFRIYWRKSTEPVVSSVWSLAAISITKWSWKISRRESPNGSSSKVTTLYLVDTIKGSNHHSNSLTISETKLPNKEHLTTTRTIKGPKPPLNRELLTSSKMFNRTKTTASSPHLSKGWSAKMGVSYVVKKGIWKQAIAQTIATKRD